MDPGKVLLKRHEVVLNKTMFEVSGRSAMMFYLEPTDNYAGKLWGNICHLLEILLAL